MSTRFDEFVKVCRDEFAEIHTKLNRLDEAVRGNGQPGLKVRVDRLEQVEAKRGRLTWIVIGAFVSAGASVLLQLGQMVLGK